MHCLIVGMGSIGQQLARQLLQQHQVTGLRRTAVSFAGVRMLAQAVQHADLSQVEPIQHVYVILTPDDYSETGYQRTFIQSIAPLRQALSCHPVQRVYFISSSSVYAQHQGEWVDENSPTCPTAYNGQVLLEAERLWREAYPEQLVVVRPSGIYGEGRLRLVNWLRSGRPVVRQAWTNRIHSTDLVGFLAYLADLEAVQDCYIVTDSRPVEQDVVLEGLAEQLGLPMVERQEGAVSGKRLSNQRLLASGYRLKYADWREGYRAVLMQ